MKSVYLFEAEGVNKTRENIVKERLVYLKYLMDNTENKTEVVELEKMYNCLYNLNYDSNGKLRSLNDMYTYINQTMTENKGLIPDLPTNDQIQAIDEKTAAFKELHKENFEAYLTRFEKSNLDKASSEKEVDAAKSVLSPENPEDNKKALKKIREISSVFGLTNIIGLEPKRQASEEDVNRKKEIKKQQRDGNPNASKHDAEEATKDTGNEEQSKKDKSDSEPGGNNKETKKLKKNDKKHTKESLGMKSLRNYLLENLE